MGQQQLLLIVLGVIIVGIAVVIGIQMFSSSAVQANLDGVISDLNKMGSDAQAWYRKPASMGGGGRTFTTLTALSLIGAPSSNANSSAYTLIPTATTGNNDSIAITGITNELGADGATGIIVKMGISKDAVGLESIGNR